MNDSSAEVAAVRDPEAERAPPPPDAAVAIERVEAASGAAGYRAAPPDYARRHRIETLEVGGATVLLVGRSRSMYLNRALGLGVARAVTPDDAEAVTEAFRSRGAKCYSIPVPPHVRPPELGAWLQARGLVRRRGDAKLWRDDAPAGDPPASDLGVVEIGTERSETWWRILADAWPKFRSRSAWVRARVGSPGWRHYLALDGSEPVGIAAMFVDGDAAHLLEGAIVASHRRRGGQSLLVHRRIEDALADGCRWLTSETAPPLPRMPLVSYRNLKRAGFRLAYVRANWRMEGR